MREVLFRIRSRGGDWYYGFPLTNRRNKIEEFVSFEGYDENGGYYYNIAEEAETLSEFTGLYDKNGKRIFEGDILRHFYWHGNEKKSRNICVHFLNGAFCWSTSADNDENCFAFADSEMYGINTEKDCEVIGNIFDNRELLEE